MPDVFTPAQRSEIMAKVRGKDTKPERVVRALTHRLGFRFRLHREDLPGKPDLVFVGRRKIIFVHGCFWHGHTCRAGQNRPASNAQYWTAKLDRNKMRDRRQLRALRTDGWDVLIIWECQVKKQDLPARLLTFLS